MNGVDEASALQARLDAVQDRLELIATALLIVGSQLALGVASDIEEVRALAAGEDSP